MSTEQIQYENKTWINVIQPTQSDVQQMTTLFPYEVHPLHIEDVSSRLERPKIDEGDDYIFIVMHFPVWDQRKSYSRATEVDFLVGRGCIVTIHEGVLKPLNRLWQRARESDTDLKRIVGRGANQAFYMMVDHLVDYIFPMLRKVDVNINALEDEIFSRNIRPIIQEIALVRRDIISLRRIIRQQIPIVEQLNQTDYPIIHEDQEEYFDDIADHLYKARDIIDENYELISALSDTVDAIASYRINEVMRILTVISVIMLPLTLISSIYGMNVVNLPLADHPSGFILISVFLLIIAISMLLYFRRRGWL